MHKVTAHILKKWDHDINLHSSSRIEKSHKKMKDVRRHLDKGPWAQTLLFRWLKRKDPFNSEQQTPCVPFSLPEEETKLFG